MTGLIEASDLADLATGAAILGSGGGGDPYIGRLIAERAVAEHGPVTLVDLADVPDDAVVIPVGLMGAPTVLVEKIPAANQLAAAVQAMADYLGTRPAYIGCCEAGGVNCATPVAAAAQLGVPLIDGDMMGRAFPELQMALPGLIGVSASPMTIVDEHGNCGILKTRDNHWTERLARPLAVEMGSSAAISMFVLTGAQARDGYVPGTLSLARTLGRTLRAARQAHADPVAAVVAVLGGRRLADGKVTDVERRTQTGFARGSATIATGAGTAVVEFQNENLIARVDGPVVDGPVVGKPVVGKPVAATTPDLIIILERDTGEPITTEALRYGQRVSVVAAPADERWHSEAGLALAGPRYFGYDTDPVRVRA
jgi:uncharacterized protein